MSESNKEIQRRELLFRLLDDLKNKGERINADKLARLAKMGKQTVLPHYNEWRFLDEADRQSDVELPEDLVRVLKRGLIQWRVTDSEKQRRFEEQANIEIDELQQLVSQMSDTQALQQKEIENLKQSKAQLEQEAAEDKAQITELKESLARSQAHHDAECKSTELLNEQIKKLKEEGKAAIEATETKLDTQYQGQINHWIKMVDNERRLRTDSETQLQKQQSQTLVAEKEKNELQYRLESKSRAYIDACEDRNLYKKQVTEAEPSLKVINDIALILNKPLAEITSTVRSICEKQQQYIKEIEAIPAFEKKIATLEKQVDKHKHLEIELEKHKSYREAMETALKNAKWAGQPEE